MCTKAFALKWKLKSKETKKNDDIELVETSINPLAAPQFPISPPKSSISLGAPQPTIRESTQSPFDPSNHSKKKIVYHSSLV